MEDVKKYKKHSVKKLGQITKRLRNLLKKQFGLNCKNIGVIKFYHSNDYVGINVVIRDKQTALLHDQLCQFLRQYVIKYRPLRVNLHNKILNKLEYTIDSSNPTCHVRHRINDYFDKRNFINEQYDVMQKIESDHSLDGLDNDIDRDKYPKNTSTRNIAWCSYKYSKIKQYDQLLQMIKQRI